MKCSATFPILQYIVIVIIVNYIVIFQTLENKILAKKKDDKPKKKSAKEMAKDRLEKFKNDEKSSIPPYRPPGFEQAPPYQKGRSIAANFIFNNFIQGQ